LNPAFSTCFSGHLGFGSAVGSGDIICYVPAFDLSELMLSPEALRKFSQRYVWWKTPEEAAAYPMRVIAQVMNLGTFEDIRRLTAEVDEDSLRDILRHAEAGQFSERSWAYWHYRLGMAEVGRVPAMPKRKAG